MLCSLLLGVLHDLADDICALFNTQNTGIQADVIVLGLAPGTAGVVLVVDAAALILFVQTLLGRLVRFAVAADDALGAVANIGKDVGMESIRAIFPPMPS